MHRRSVSIATAQQARGTDCSDDPSQLVPEGAASAVGEGWSSSFATQPPGPCGRQNADVRPDLKGTWGTMPRAYLAARSLPANARQQPSDYPLARIKMIEPLLPLANRSPAGARQNCPTFSRLHAPRRASGVNGWR